MNAKLENFMRATRTGSAGCRRMCNCGKEYFHSDDFYTWEPGEYEQLQSTAVALDHSVGDISFEGKDYVDCCACWHKRAEELMTFIDGHAHAIAKYLTLEKERKQSEATNSPIVK